MPDPLGFTFTSKDNIQWVRQPFQKPIFENMCVPNLESHIETLDEPIDYFSRYITPDIINTFALKTNLYALQKGRNFPPLTSNEVKVFLGLQIVIGTLKFPQLRMHWEEKFKMPMFEQMSRNRFSSIQNNLPLIDNLEIPQGSRDKFIKVRPICDAIKIDVNKFQLKSL